MSTPWRNKDTKSPCKGCEKRYVGCHSDPECGKYKPKDYDFGKNKAERDYVHYLVETKRRFAKK